MNPRDLEERDPHGSELVKISLAAWPRLPHLVSDYLGPVEWLRESREADVQLDALLARALRVASLAEREGDGYVAVQARAVATQIEVEADPRKFGYVELVERLLACQFVEPDQEELASLAREVEELAAGLGLDGEGAIERWEASHLVSGEAKWDVAFEAYVAGRQYARDDFPIVFDERLDIGRTVDPITSLHLTWREPDRLLFEVNVDVGRTPATTRYEVAHNIYPGDYLHMAVLTQSTYEKQRRAAASIKLKNAPENVVAEGIEEVAPFRLRPDPEPEDRLAWKLEWLRRSACLTGAVKRRGRSEPRPAVLEHLMTMGHMSERRAQQELDRIEHPLWGTYQYTYWLGRRLVEDADARAGEAVTKGPYLEWLYGGLHVPAAFLEEARKVVSGAEARP